MSFQKLVKGAYLFKEFKDQEIEEINKIVKESFFGPGEEVFSQGDTATAMYVIKLGSIRIEQKGRQGENIAVATLGTGSLFGEMAFVDGENRSATAVAAEKTEILSIDFAQLKELLRKNEKMATTFYMTFTKFLCNRLRVTTTDLSFAKEKNLRHF